MTNWNSPMTLQQNSLSLARLIHALLGIFAWEWLVNLHFDVSMLLRRRTFRWQMIFYLLARYSTLGALIGYCILLDSTSPLNCGAGYRTIFVLGGTSLFAVSCTLCLRTMAVWNHDRRVVFPLIVLALGHLALVIRAIVSAHAVWVPGSGCVATNVDLDILASVFAYEMAFDFIILGLTVYNFWGGHIWKECNGILKVLFQDGLVYFIVVLVINTVAVVFSFLKLNPIMGLIAQLPAITFTAIASGRLVRRLSEFTDERHVLELPTIHSSSTCSVVSKGQIGSG